MGLWDLIPHHGGLRRDLYRPMWEALRNAQDAVASRRSFGATADALGDVAPEAA
jgi:hypothetical protein